MEQITPPRAENRLLITQLLVLSAFAVSALFLWQGHKGFDLGDEGFLWYGVQRVLAGEVPLRDFKSDEPGRYYWSAALLSLRGDHGIMALRGAVALFQAIGLFLALLLIARTQRKQNLPYLVLAALILVAWMFPRHKLFDITLSIFLVAALSFLLTNPTARRFFLTGACVGLVAGFGRNHGVYGIAGSLGAVAWLGLTRRGEAGLVKGMAFWCAGVVAGFLPILLMMALVPGFAQGLWNDVYFFVGEIKSTNLSLAIPWPWRAAYTTLLPVEALRQGLVGLLFMVLPLYGVVGLGWALWQKRRGRAVAPEVAASCLMALVYTHFAYSRADINHLAQSIFPLLIGCLVWIAQQPRKLMWPLGLLLCAASLLVMSAQHPGWKAMVNQRWVQIKVSGNDLWVDPQTAHGVRLLRELVARYAPNGQGFVALPFWPGAYALFGRKCPMWENYALFPRSRAFELAEIGRIRRANPGFLFYLDYALDGQDERRFSHTHPLTHQYILENFHPSPQSPNPNSLIYLPRNRPDK